MYLLFDIGGTKIRLAGTIDHQTISEPLILENPGDFETAISNIKEALPRLIQGQKIDKAAGGVPGPLNEAKDKLLRAPNLPGWADQPLKKLLQDLFQCPVMLENDAALVGLGEAIYGSGKGKKIVGFLTISTGVGGVRIVDGKIDDNSLGFEPGHQIISLEDGTTHDLESLVSGTAIEKIYHQKPENITDEAVWDRVAKFLSIGLHNVIVQWSPDIVVLGGGVMKSLPLELVQKHLQENLKIFPNPPGVVKASLGEKGGLYGALELISESGSSQPE